MKALSRRLEALEGVAGLYSIGELLDSLDGTPLPEGKRVHPAFLKAMGNMADA
tara:strand:- start:869 stop:1027 length:159 start_codon:yes stop_codon:yes gene_type:complete